VNEVDEVTDEHGRRVSTRYVQSPAPRAPPVGSETQLRRLTLPLATFTFGDALLEALEIAVLVVWVWIAIGVLLDIFRSHDLTGWGKAAWVLLIMILPFLGVLIYLIARGHKMHEHAARDAKAHEDAFRQYVRSAASTPVDDIAKLEDLKNRDVLTDEEFERAKTKALA
jgi:hypothetical protein